MPKTSKNSFQKICFCPASLAALGILVGELNRAVSNFVPGKKHREMTVPKYAPAGNGLSCLRAVRIRRGACDRCFYQTVAGDPLLERPNRSEPRVVKRRPKNFRLWTKTPRADGRGTLAPTNAARVPAKNDSALAQVRISKPPRVVAQVFLFASRNVDSVANAARKEAKRAYNQTEHPQCLALSRSTKGGARALHSAHPARTRPARSSATPNSIKGSIRTGSTAQAAA